MCIPATSVCIQLVGVVWYGAIMSCQLVPCSEPWKQLFVSWGFDGLRAFSSWATTAKRFGAKWQEGDYLCRRGTSSTSNMQCWNLNRIPCKAANGCAHCHAQYVRMWWPALPGGVPSANVETLQARQHTNVKCRARICEEHGWLFSRQNFHQKISKIWQMYVAKAFRVCPWKLSFSRPLGSKYIFVRL